MKRVGLILVVAARIAQAQTSDIAFGIEALARRDVRAADVAFARAATGENVQLRPSGLQWRAHVAWRLRGDTSAAIRYLDQAVALSRFNSPILLESARLSGARRRYHAAVSTAREAMISSVDVERRGQATRTLVSLAVDGAFAAGRAPIADSVDLRLLAPVRDSLAARVRRFLGRTTDARALIDAAAMLGDSVSVEAGLRSYRFLSDSGMRWAAEPVTARPLAAALAATGLYESAALFMKASPPSANSPLWLQDLPNYADFLRAAEREVQRVYRASLAGTARNGDVSRAVISQGRRLWPILRWAARPPEFYPAALYRELATRFGTDISLEQSRGMDEVYIGHRVGTYPVAVGRGQATVVVLDGITASGIDAWLLDGTGGRAGWVARDTIFARRTAFTETPYRAWVALADPQTMPGEMLRIVRDSTGDIDRARRDSLGYFPGVAGRMFRNGATPVLDSLRAVDSMPEVDRAGAFAQTLYRSLTTSSITLHESRHIADARAGRGTEVEFRAKVDEVSRAERPRLAMTAILTPNIGDPSNHGLANRRIMIELSRWIRAHGREIAGYDVTAPTLLQLPLLKDEQLRAAFASMRQP